MKLLLLLLLFAPPDTVRIEGREYVLDAYAYYNRMPSPGNPRSGLIVITWLVETSKRRTAEIEPQTVHVYQKDQVWSGRGNKRIMEHKIEYTIRGGPEWPVGSFVNVALQFKYKGVYYLIGRPCVRIEEIY